jgi:hypothetical protein
LDGCLITENSARYGGGIESSISTLFIKNSLLLNNNGELGGALSLGNGSVSTLLNVTISGNTASVGGGAIRIHDSNTRVKLVNSILWDNLPQEVYFDASGSSNSFTAAFSNILGDLGGVVTSSVGDVFWLTGNLNADPLFADTTHDNYSLQGGSPCIDTGIQDTTIYYNSGMDTLIVSPLNFIGSAPDMGAFEYSDLWKTNGIRNSIFNNYIYLKQTNLRER